jgi:hypothetical protein
VTGSFSANWRPFGRPEIDTTEHRSRPGLNTIITGLARPLHYIKRGRSGLIPTRRPLSRFCNACAHVETLLKPDETGQIPTETRLKLDETKLN